MKEQTLSRTRPWLFRQIFTAQAEVPIILLTTANSQAAELQEEINQRRSFGCWHILEKPFELQKLTEAIERGLANLRGHSIVQFNC